MRKGKVKLEHLRTWIEIDSHAAKKNYDTFRKLIGPRVKLWAVVKSNAYGHGLVLFSKLVEKFWARPVRGREGSQRASASNGVDGFCVDSLVEGLRLRKEGIKKPILVLGPTLPALFPEAAKRRITITISNFDALKALAKFVDKKSTKKSGREKKEGRGVRAARRDHVPEFHLKIDTGMHRQGFYLEDVPKVIRFLDSRFRGNDKKKLTGIFTHFASAKDINYPTYTEKQCAEFEKAAALFEKAGFTHLVKHASATGGTLIDKKYHLDAVRVGIGLYGLWPSKELEMQLPNVHLEPVLHWRARVSEVKPLKAGDYVGYDLAERMSKKTRMAVVPVGYWYGFTRSLSGTGEALVDGRRAKVLGRVSMDLLVLDIGKIKARPGDMLTLIGKMKGSELNAYDVARKAGLIHYELLTRLNPLIERILI